MKKKSKTQRKVIITLVVLVIIFLSLFYLRNSLYSFDLDNETYKSDILNFMINLPANFKVSDTGITLVLKNSNGEVSIIRNGTQYDDLKSYLVAQDLDSNYVIQDVVNMKVDGLTVVARTESYGDKNIKFYYVYAPNSVYILSTSSEDLYDELDQIAKSFKYTGN